MNRLGLLLGGIALAACSNTNTTSEDARAGQSGEEHAGQEHAREEHAGQEHAGEEHADQEHAREEHAGQEHPTEPAHVFTAAEIKTAMNAHIKKQIEAGQGDFLITDDVKSEDLILEFVKIHDPVRIVEGKGYFACTDFHPKGAAADKLYDLDFWLSAKNGALEVTKTRIHKHPTKDGDDKWVKKARYTFVNDNPVEVQ